ncbi:MAG: hypothetical protein Q4C67_09715, partial [Deinococcus sp.]|nr:hypothetical protein [Deinococcus sp.]
GNSFTVSIPVTNTTDRTIKLTATAGAPSGTGAAQLTVAPVNAEASVPAGQTTTLTFTLAFSSSMDAAQAGQTVAVVFDVAATAGDDNTSAEGSSF